MVTFYQILLMMRNTVGMLLLINVGREAGKEVRTSDAPNIWRWPVRNEAIYVEGRGTE